MLDCNVTVIGAGPYGLSSAAYLQAAGIETRVIGEPMSFWKTRCQQACVCDRVGALLTSQTRSKS